MSTMSEKRESKLKRIALKQVYSPAWPDKVVLEELGWLKRKQKRR